MENFTYELVMKPIKGETESLVLNVSNFKDLQSQETPVNSTCPKIQSKRLREKAQMLNKEYLTLEDMLQTINDRNKKFGFLASSLNIGKSNMPKENHMSPITCIQKLGKDRSPKKNVNISPNQLKNTIKLSKDSEISCAPDKHFSVYSSEMKLKIVDEELKSSNSSIDVADYQELKVNEESIEKNVPNDNMLPNKTLKLKLSENPVEKKANKLVRDEKDAKYSNNFGKHIKQSSYSSSKANVDEQKSNTCLTVVESYTNLPDLKVLEKATLKTKISTCKELPKQHLSLKASETLLESNQDKTVTSEKEMNEDGNPCHSAKQFNISCSFTNACEPQSNVSCETVEDSQEKFKVHEELKVNQKCNEEISMTNFNKFQTLPLKVTDHEKTFENTHEIIGYEKCTVLPNSSCKYLELLNISSTETISEEPKSNVFPKLFESCQNALELKIEDEPSLEKKTSFHEDHPKQSTRVKEMKVKEGPSKFGEVLTVHFSEVKLKEPISEKIKSVIDNDANDLRKDDGNFECEKKDVVESNTTDSGEYLFSSTKIDSVELCYLLDTKNCTKTCFSKMEPFVALSKLPHWVDDYKRAKVKGKKLLKPIGFLETRRKNTKEIEFVTPVKRLTRSDGKYFKVDFNATLPDIRSYKKRIKEDSEMLPFHGFSVPFGYLTLPESYFICRRSLSFDSSDDSKVESALSLDGRRGCTSVAKEVSQNRTNLSLLVSTEGNAFDKIYDEIIAHNRCCKSKRSKKTASIKKRMSKSSLNKRKCLKDFCGFGCVCDSLMVKKRTKVHCGHEECMFSSYCYKSCNESLKFNDQNKPSLWGTMSPKGAFKQNKRIRKPPKRLFEDDMIIENYASSPLSKRPCIVDNKRTEEHTLGCNVLLSNFNFCGANVRCMYHCKLNCPCFVDESYEEKLTRNLAMKSTAKNLLQSTYSVSKTHARKTYLHNVSRSNNPGENSVGSKLVRYQIPDGKKLASPFCISKTPIESKTMTSSLTCKTPGYNNEVLQSGVTTSSCQMLKEKSKLPKLSGLIPAISVDSRNSQLIKVQDYFRNFKEFQRVITSNDINCKQLEMMCSFSLKPLPQNSIRIMKLCVLDELIKNKLAYLWLRQRLNNRDRIFVTDNFSPPGFSCKYIEGLASLPSEITKKFTIETIDARKLSCFILTCHYMCWEISGALDLHSKVSITEDYDTSESSGDPIFTTNNLKNIRFSGKSSGEKGNLNMLLKKNSSESESSFKNCVRDESDSKILEVTVEQLRNYGRPIFKKQLYQKIKRGEIDKHSINSPFTIEIQPLIRGMQFSPASPYFESNCDSACNNEEFVWYRLDLNGEFDKLVYEEKLFNVSHTELMYSVSMARENGCLLRVLFDQSEKDYQYPWKKGIYADPWINSSAVRIGPYLLDEYTGIITYVRVDGLHRATVPLLKLESVTLKSDLCTNIEAYVHSDCSGQYIDIKNKEIPNLLNLEVDTEIDDPRTCTIENSVSGEAESELDIKIQDVQGNWAGFNDIDNLSGVNSSTSLVSYDNADASFNNFIDSRIEVSNPRIDNQDGFHQSQMIGYDFLPSMKPVSLSRFSLASTGNNTGSSIKCGLYSNLPFQKKVNLEPLSVKPKRSVAIKSTTRPIPVTNDALKLGIESSNIVLGYLVPDIPDIHPIPVAKGGMTSCERNILTMKNPIYKTAGTLHFTNLEEANMYLNNSLRKIIHFFPSALRIVWSFLKVDSIGKNGKVDGLMELDKLTNDMFITPKGLFHYDNMTREALLRCGINVSVSHRFLEAKRRRIIYLAKKELLCLFPVEENTALVKIMAMAQEDIKLQGTVDDFLSKEKETELQKKEMLLKKLKEMCTDAEMDDVMKKLQQIKRPERYTSANFSRISLQDHPKSQIKANCGNKQSRIMKLSSVKSFRKSILRQNSKNSNVSNKKVSAGTYQLVKSNKGTLIKRGNSKSLDHEASVINSSVVSEAYSSEEIPVTKPVLKPQGNDELAEKVVCGPAVDYVFAEQTSELKAVPDMHEVKSFSRDCINTSLNYLTRSSLPSYSILKTFSKNIPETKPTLNVHRNDAEIVFCEPIISDILPIPTSELKPGPDMLEVECFSKDYMENSFNPLTNSLIPEYSMHKKCNDLAEKPGSYMKFEESVTNTMKPFTKDVLKDDVSELKWRESGNSHEGLFDESPGLTLECTSVIPGNFEQKESDFLSLKPQVATVAPKEFLHTSVIKKQIEIANKLKNKNAITGIPIFSLEGEMHFSREGLLKTYTRQIRCLSETHVQSDAKDEEFNVNIVSKTPFIDQVANVTVSQDKNTVSGSR